MNLFVDWQTRTQYKVDITTSAEDYTNVLNLKVNDISITANQYNTNEQNFWKTYINSWRVSQTNYTNLNISFTTTDRQQVSINFLLTNGNKRITLMYLIVPIFVH